MYSYRTFATEHKTKMVEGFIDGDLVERFLDLPEAQMAETCKTIKVRAQTKEFVLSSVTITFPRLTACIYEINLEKNILSS